MSAFERLHPALQHHIVNSLEWRSLRPLQEEAIEPLLSGQNALLLAPTAGGKTEAAFFPVLSRMLADDWKGLSVLYICPIRALLNNLHLRLMQYGGYVGRRAALWHGDVKDSEKARFTAEPSDVLLTTPESLEVMLVSRRIDHRALFRNVRVAIVDELHAFAGDDRGWHLLSVLERVTKLAGRELQRIGLSATVGNPDELVGWLAGSSEGAGGTRVIAPASNSGVATLVGLDYVGTIANAARVISELHAGEKRLVFVDSRARVEELAAELRRTGTDTYVSHSSLSLDERRRAESAFAAGRNCVIVATSTLELGIDVGDLDRVIQVDAPWSVSSFLQRLGRTGRRPGTERNCLFLATKENAFLRAAAIIELWGRGFVEPIVPPPLPYHILAQQLMALALQEGGIGSQSWRGWIARMPGFASMAAGDMDAVVQYMIGTGLLFDEEGVLWLGPEGENSYGHKNFLELFSVFTTPPLFRVLHGRAELGEVDPTSFQVRTDGNPVLVLAGRSWEVTHVDWRLRTAYVHPIEEKGKSRWPGHGGGLHFELCRAVRRVLSGIDPPAEVSSRARHKLEEARAPFHWLDDESTAVVLDADGRLRWWTFAGLLANSALAEFSFVRAESRPSDFSIHLQLGSDVRALERGLKELAPAASRHPKPPVNREQARGLKFEKCLPPQLTSKMLAERIDVPKAVAAVVREPVRVVKLVE